MSAPLSVFIADDEPLARRRLRRALAAFPEFSVVGEAGDTAAALAEIERLRPRLLLLDIQMPGGGGLEIARRLSYRPRIIFCTAFDQYALDAFAVHALDYLLKPWTRERLRAALARALELEGQAPAEADAAWGDSLRRLLETWQAPRRLACHGPGGVFFLAPDDVVWFEAVDTLTRVHAVAAADDAPETRAPHEARPAAPARRPRLQIARTLDQLEAELGGLGFFRAHRAALVNLRYLRRVAPLFNGNGELTLEHFPQPVPLSRRRASALREKFPW